MPEAERGSYERALARLAELGGDRCPLTRRRCRSEQFSRGLDAPICLTWELTYACNLACVHCLSSSGRRDPGELTPAEARAHRRRAGRHAGLLREHRRGRADAAAGLLRPGLATRSTTGRGEVLHQRHPAHRRAGARSWRRWTTSTCRSASTAPRPRPTTPSAAREPSPPPGPPWTTWPRPGSARSRSASSCTRENVEQLDALAAIADSYGAQLRLTRLRPSGRGVDSWDALHPTADAAAHALPLVARAPGRPDRRLLLPPLRLRRAARRAEPVRRGTGGLPDRPGRRRLRLPVRDRPGVPGRQRARRRAGSPPCGASRSCSRRCASRRARAPARPAAPTTPARAAAWRPSSSPGLPLDGPDPECVYGHGEEALAARSERPTAAALGHSKVDRDGSADAGAHARSLPLAGYAPEPVELAGATWPEVEATGGRCVLPCPLGSLEQHGPHLPLDTDTRIAAELATGLALAVAMSPWPRRRLRRQRRARGFPGTLLVGHEVLAELARRTGALRPRLVRRRGARQCPRGQRGGAGRGGAPSPRPKVTTCSCGGRRTQGGDAHAGRTETSLMLAIDPSAVRLELAEPGCTEPLPSSCPVCAEGVRPVSSNGVLGDPHRCERGGRPRILASLVHELVRRGLGTLASPAMSPVAVVTGAARGIGAATVDAWCRPDGKSWPSTRARTIPPRLPAGHGGRPRGARPAHGDAVHTMVGDVRSPSDMRRRSTAAVEAVRRPGRRRRRRPA